jgi:hypothetical protein
MFPCLWGVVCLTYGCVLWGVYPWGVLFWGVVWGGVGVGSSPCFLGGTSVWRARGVCGVGSKPVAMVLWLVCLEEEWEELFL